MSEDKKKKGRWFDGILDSLFDDQELEELVAGFKEIKEEVGKAIQDATDVAKEAHSKAKEGLRKARDKKIKSLHLANLPGLTPEPEALELFSAGEAVENLLVPFKRVDSVVHLAVCEDSNLSFAFKRATQLTLRFKFYYAPPAELKRALADYYVVEEPEEEAPVVQSNPDAEVAQGASLNMMVAMALMRSAKEIHVVPTAKTLKIKLHVEGKLEEVMSFPEECKAPIVGALKLTAGLDPEVRALAQASEVDVRLTSRKSAKIYVVVTPTEFGEQAMILLRD